MDQDQALASARTAPAGATRRHAIRTLSSTMLGLTLPSFQYDLARECGQAAPVMDGTPMCFTDSSGVAHQLYIVGTAGPPVLLLHEISGLTRETFLTARQLAAARYRVVVPLLFGSLGGGGSFGFIRTQCGDDRFACRHGDKTSPQVKWLCELASFAARQWPDGKGVGVIGMCLTGAFPLAMLRAPEVVAPVLCQPTLPFNPKNIFAAFGWFSDKSALAVDPEDLRHAKSLTVPLLGIRYQGDRKCPKKRFERLATEFPHRFYRLDFPGRHHSTLVGDFCADALTEVLAFFNHRLRSTPDTCTASFPMLSRTGAAEVTAEGCRGGTPSSASHHHLLNTDKGVPCSSG